MRTELAGMDPSALRSAARDRTASVLGRVGGEPFDVMALVARAVPVGVLGGALGVDETGQDALVRAVSAIAAAYHPGATPERIARADTAVAELVALLGPGDAGGRAGRTGPGDAQDGPYQIGPSDAESAADRSVPGDAEGAVHRAGSGDAEVVANRIGLLVQACDATAGLVGNTLDAALRLPAASRREWPVEALVAETLRLNPPVRSTRRSATAVAEIGGRVVTPGTLVILDFAAANRDPRVFPKPDRFDPGRHTHPHSTGDPGEPTSVHPRSDPDQGTPAHLRPDPEHLRPDLGQRTPEHLRPDSDQRTPVYPGSGPVLGEPAHLTFGYGARACPGMEHGVALACGILSALLPGCERAGAGGAYEPSANLRIPLRLEVRVR